MAYQKWRRSVKGAAHLYQGACCACSMRETALISGIIKA